MRATRHQDSQSSSVGKQPWQRIPAASRFQLWAPCSMGTLSNGGFWWSFLAGEEGGARCRGRRKVRSSSSESVNLREERGWSLYDFPVKQAAIAASLALTGDTIAQFRDCIVVRRKCQSLGDEKEPSFWSNHDWLRSLRMLSYGFLLYGPGSYAWYQFLDRCMPKPTFVTLSTKVILNQIVLGPCVIAVIFAWNNLWLGKLSELPAKYQKDALPTLLYGFRFWIPATILNFGVVPLSVRVAFMSTCSIFWNFYLATTLSR